MEREVEREVERKVEREVERKVERKVEREVEIEGMLGTINRRYFARRKLCYCSLSCSSRGKHIITC